MDWLVYFGVGLYCFSILLIFLYSIAQLNLMVNYLKHHKKTNTTDSKFDFTIPNEIPYVTIQLPIYNEKYVVERLLKTIAAFNYPKDKLEIQVLDDSTDDSVKKTNELIQEIQKTGIDIQHITRADRFGYKAGALKEGLKTCKGEFIAIFDADFIPEPNWLYQTIPFFKDAKIGVVQTRWGHINKDYSVLTKIQAFALDAHFTLEQVGRNSKSHFINFNGTAGVWRKSCILEAGNWESDTLTEDLDLSYRAQLLGWKFKYLEDVVTKAELPAVISAVRSQQYRWNKGGAENFMKLAKRVITNNNMSFKTKFHGVLHLLNSSMFLSIFLMALLSVPMLFVKNSYPELDIVFNILAFFVISTVIFFIYFWISFKNTVGGGFKNFFKYIGSFIAFYTIALGFTFQNSVSVFQGLIGKKTAFIRTPKFNIEEQTESWKKNSYINHKVSKNVFFEFILAAYFAFAIFSAFKLNDYGLLPFHLMLFVGYSYTLIKSFSALKH